MSNIGLPSRRRDKTALKVKKEYSYLDILEKDIKVDEISFVTIGKADLGLDFEKLKVLLNSNNGIRIKFLDWDSAIYIDSILDNSIDTECFLVDDGLRIPRDYIDITKLKKINVSIPLNYLMWGVRFQNEIKTYCFQIYYKDGNYINLTSTNGNEELSKQALMQIKQIVSMLESYGMDNDFEKVMLVSDYIQSHTQFVEGYESQSSRGTFVTPDFPKNYIQAAMIESVLNNNGKCVGISNLSTLLLNNPELDVETETVKNSAHAWNKVLIDGKYYYFDNTWNITRTDDPCTDGLITLSFSNKYNLFGKETALNIGHHVPTSVPFYNNGILSEEDYIKQQYSSVFSYPQQPFFKSHRR